MPWLVYEEFLGREHISIWYYDPSLWKSQTDPKRRWILIPDEDAELGVDACRELHKDHGPEPTMEGK